MILHLGDHDPSGLDMTRDIQDRLDGFGCRMVKVVRIALTMAQVHEFQPPPNPTKLTDVRSTDYVAEYGDESWELDALSPETLASLINEWVDEAKDKTLFAKREKLEKEMRKSLLKTSQHWREVEAYAKTLKHKPTLAHPYDPLEPT